MKQWIVCVVGVYALCGVFAFAEEPIKATTDSGKKVILYLDGTWKYIKNEIPSGSRKQVFSRTVQATEKAEFAGGKYILFFDSSKWQREESEEAGHLKWR